MGTETDNQETDGQAESQVQEESIESLKQQLEVAQIKAQESFDGLLRSKAEAENVRRRAKIDIENAHKYGSEKFARELLNVLDGLERGLEVTEGDSEQVKSIREGMELTYKMFLDVFDKFGIKMINPAGEPFNPNQHEALTMQESADVAPNTVLTVVQRGFTIYDRVLRPARVVVAKAPAASAE